MAVMTHTNSWILRVALLFVVAMVGCDRRRYYRQEADREVDLLVKEAATTNPTYAFDDFTIRMDPRSRYFYDQDRDAPPMPMDDPDSNRYMQVVDGKRAWPGWERNGITNQFENPYWREMLMEYVEQTGDGKIVLDLDTALMLARMHSPTYQSQLETLYLSALDVSAERFSLDTQFFAGTDQTYSHLGQLRPGGESNTQRIDNNLELRKRFATAGQLLVGLANSFVFTFTGNNTDTTLSIFNFSLVQPLLRNGGRVIALETLTIVERALFNNLRAFQRYRRGFFTSIAIGNNGTTGPRRRGGFLGGTGLTGFTGTGAGGIGGVGAGTFGFGGGFGGAGGGGGGAGTGLAGGGAGNVGGFIGLLQSLQQYRNARDSLDLQLRTLALLEGNLEGGVVDVVEVDQFRQTIETQRAQLLQSQNGLQSQIENYLTGTLGLPPDLAVDLDDDFIRRFQLIDPTMTGFQNEIYRVQGRIGELEEAPGRPVLLELMTQVTKNLEGLINYYDAIRTDVDGVDQSIADRRENMEPSDLTRLLRNSESWKSQLDPLLDRLKAAGDDLNDIQSRLSDDNTADVTAELVVWLRRYLSLTQEIVLLQARARLQNVYLTDPIRLDVDCALKIAYANRLDYMNARASLVDTWRLIEFNANRLKSDLSITASGDLRTDRNNPVSFRDHAGNASLGIQFDAPFARLLERNNFRGALIEYQSARRSFVQATDGINQSMRNLLRSLNELELNLEIQRRAVDIAIRRVEVTEEKLQEPPNPDDPNRFGPTDVQNLSSALADLRNSQNNLMSVWLNYYSTRMLLVRELGVMELDENGMWIDLPIDESLCLEQDCLCNVPPELPQELIDEVFEGQPMPESLPDAKSPELRSPQTQQGFNYFESNQDPAASPSRTAASPVSAGRSEDTYLQAQRNQAKIRRMNTSADDQAASGQSDKMRSAKSPSADRFVNFDVRSRGQTAGRLQKQGDDASQLIRETRPRNQVAKGIELPKFRLFGSGDRETATQASRIESASQERPAAAAKPQKSESGLRWAHRLQAPSGAKAGVDRR